MKAPYNRIIKNQCEKNNSNGTLHSFFNSDSKTVCDGNNDAKNNVTNQFIKKPISSIIAKPTSNPISKPIEVKITLVSDSRVHVGPSNKIIAVLLSGLSGSVYDLKNNSWTFDIVHYEKVTNQLHKNKIIFQKIPNGTLAIARRQIPQESFILEGDIYTRLIGFQRDAVTFALNRNGRVLLADDMGLGKTIQAIAIAHYYRMEWPLLIIAPASLLNNWAEAFASFLDEKATIIQKRCDFGDKISILSYELAVMHRDIIRMNDYGVIICDECHYLKHSASKRTKELLPILQKASRLIMISGTPAESRPLELYTILCALDKSLYPSLTAYGNRYCGGRKIHNFYDYKGCTNAGELALVIEKAFMVRRLKASVLGDLPKKFRRQTLLDVPVTEPVILDALDNIIDNVLEEPSVMKEFANAAVSKIGPVIEYLRAMLTKNIKTVVFAHHQVMLDGIEEFCKEIDIAYIRIDGSTPLPKRHALISSFQSDETMRLAILSIKACSTGLTLTSGKAAVFAELFWNPGTLLQAEDRIHRIGQNDNVEIHYLIGRGTIDEQVWPHILKKMVVLESLGIGNDDFRYLKKSAGGKTQTYMDDFISK